MLLRAGNCDYSRVDRGREAISVMKWNEVVAVVRLIGHRCRVL